MPVYSYAEQFATSTLIMETFYFQFYKKEYLYIH